MKARISPFGEAKYTGLPATRPSASSNFGATSLTRSLNTHLPVSTHLLQEMHPRISLPPTWIPAYLFASDLDKLGLYSFSFEDSDHLFKRCCRASIPVRTSVQQKNFAHYSSSPTYRRTSRNSLPSGLLPPCMRSQPVLPYRRHLPGIHQHMKAGQG